MKRNEAQHEGRRRREGEKETERKRIELRRFNHRYKQSSVAHGGVSLNLQSVTALPP